MAVSAAAAPPTVAEPHAGPHPELSPAAEDYLVGIVEHELTASAVRHMAAVLGRAAPGACAPAVAARSLARGPRVRL